MNPELMLYIKAQLAAGMPKDVIKELLIARGGWHVSDVDAAFTNLEPKPVAPIFPTPTPTPVAAPNSFSQSPAAQSPISRPTSAPIAPVNAPTPAVSSWLAPKPAAAPVPPVQPVAPVTVPVQAPIITASVSPLTVPPQNISPITTSTPAPVMQSASPLVSPTPPTIVPAPAAPSPQQTPVLDYTLVQGSMGSPEPKKEVPFVPVGFVEPRPAVQLHPIEPLTSATPPQPLKPINDIRPTGTIAPATPAFVGMRDHSEDSDVVITETTPKRRTGKIIAGIVAVIILLALGGGAAYAYVFYVNPTPARAFAMVIPKLASAQTGHYKATITATYDKNLASMLTVTPAGLTPPTETAADAANPDATATIVVDGTFDKTTAGSYKAQSTITASTSVIPLNLSFETRLIDANLYVKVPDLGFLSDVIGTQNVATGDWVEVSKAELVQASQNDPMLASKLPIDPALLFSGSASGDLTGALLSSDVIVPTVELSKDTYNGASVHRYQFTVDQNALKQALVKGMPEISPDILSQALGNFTVTGGEIWTGLWDGKPYKILFTVKPAGTLAQSVSSISFDIALDSFGTPVSIAAPTGAKPLISIIEDAAKQAKDQSIMQSISSIKAQAEMYYASKRTYLGLCSAPTGLSPVIDSLTAIEAPASVYCKDSARAFAVAAPLVTQTGVACVDVAGTPAIIPQAPTATSCK